LQATREYVGCLQKTTKEPQRKSTLVKVMRSLVFNKYWIGVRLKLNKELEVKLEVKLKLNQNDTHA
jgi:hypothetical protein